MIYTRNSVWANGGTFDDPLLYWYAKGVGVLQQRPIDNSTSWRFMAAIHGINEPRWQQYGYLRAGEPLPPRDIQDVLWNQCQHQTWYFLPWHRGYVAALEALVRAAIVQLGGPGDWALPYWNYSDERQSRARELPPAFAQRQLPDGSDNPLFIVQRYGDGTTPIVLPREDVALTALNTIHYTGTGPTDPGFGGPKTVFSHFGRTSGGLENRPHNFVHNDIGGSNRDGPGLMSDPRLAALDPIFWLHHANIDRLWVVWLGMGKGRSNPDDPAWLTGPVPRRFVMPDVQGRFYEYSAKDVLDTTAPPLNYKYDDVSAPVLPVRATERLRRLGVAVRTAEAAGEVDMASGKPAELVGANEETMAVVGSSVSTWVRLDPPSMDRVMRSFTAIEGILAAEPAEPDRVFLVLENIRGDHDAGVIDVYVDLPDGVDGAEPPEHKVGSVALFGVRGASEPDGEHGGSGLTTALEITEIIDQLQVEGVGAQAALEVRLVPRQPFAQEQRITVDRIGVYREPR